jgi:hypothetical protein
MKNYSTKVWKQAAGLLGKRAVGCENWDAANLRGVKAGFGISVLSKANRPMQNATASLITLSWTICISRRDLEKSCKQIGLLGCNVQGFQEDSVAFFAGKS